MSGKLPTGGTRKPALVCIDRLDLFKRRGGRVDEDIVKHRKFRCTTTLLCLREHFRPDASRAVDSGNRAVGRDWPGFQPARFIEKPQATLQFDEDCVGRGKNVERNCEFTCEGVTVILGDMNGLTGTAVNQCHCRRLIRNPL